MKTTEKIIENNLEILQEFFINSYSDGHDGGIAKNGATKMLAYKNDPTVKNNYVKRVRAHYAAGDIVQGIHWEDGRGDCIGCAIHVSDDPYKKFAAEIGPEWLAHLANTLFEGCAPEYSRKFVVDFYEAIPAGVYLEPVRWKFCAFILRQNIERVRALEISDELKKQIIDATRQCLAVHENAIVSGEWSQTILIAAENAAWNAENVAWNVESARKIMENATWSAENAAWSAAWSLRSPAWSVRTGESASSVTYECCAEELLRLLREARSAKN